MRWLWLEKTQPDKPWAAFPIQVQEPVKALFAAAMNTIVGDGNTTMFWTDNWLHGTSLAVLAPHIFAQVPKRQRNRRKVSEVLHEFQWTHDIRGALSVAALAEFIGIVDLLEEVQLLSGVPDKHQWRFSASRQYSSKSAYETLFIGAVHFEPWELIWKSWAPKKCQFFIWLAIHKRSWTVDKLARRGLPHPTCCVLYDQVEEDIQHILIGCVFAKQVWFQMLSE
jgi:hypothetical protein